MKFTHPQVLDIEGHCADCDLGLLEFYDQYTGKPRDLSDFTVHHKLVLLARNCDTGKPARLDFNYGLQRRKQKIPRFPWSSGCSLQPFTSCPSETDVTTIHSSMTSFLVSFMIKTLLYQCCHHQRCSKQSYYTTCITNVLYFFTVLSNISKLGKSFFV